MLPFRVAHLIFPSLSHSLSYFSVRQNDKPLTVFKEVKGSAQIRIQKMNDSMSDHGGQNLSYLCIQTQRGHFVRWLRQYYSSGVLIFTIQG